MPRLRSPLKLKTQSAQSKSIIKADLLRIWIPTGITILRSLMLSKIGESLASGPVKSRERLSGSPAWMLQQMQPQSK
jgi:hypothetical protein